MLPRTSVLASNAHSEVPGNTRRQTIPDGPEVVTSNVSNRPELQKFQLPRLPSPGPFDPNEAKSRGFSLESLIHATQSGQPHTILKEYLSYYPSSLAAELKKGGVVAGFPSVFFAVETNKPDIVRIWLDHGADVNARDPNTGLPLLAFAIINSARFTDSMSVFSTLLAYGADVSVIPHSVYAQNIEGGKPPHNTPTPDVKPTTDQHNWCNPYFTKEITTSVSVSQKYFLRRRQRIPHISGRTAQASRVYGFAPMYNLPFTMVGQDTAIEILKERLSVYLMTPVTGDAKPLVLAFAGMSSHLCHLGHCSNT
jgi:hypothetical protein